MTSDGPLAYGRVARRLRVSAWRTAPLWLAIGLALLSAPRVADAHAELIRSDPAADSILEVAPRQVELWFSEEPEPRFSEIQVLDRTQRRMDRRDLRPDPSDRLGLIVGVGDLPHGTFTVTWKALSAVDGHVTRGVFAFTVGLDQVPTAPVLASAAEGSTATADQVAVRVLNYVGLALLLGAFPFLLWVLPHALRSGVARMDIAEVVTRRVGNVALVGAGLAIIGALGSLVAETATASSVPFFEAIGDQAVAVALGTRFGLLWWFRLALLATITLLVVLERTGPPSRTALRVGALFGLALLLDYALGTHAAAVPDATPASVALDWAHVVAVSCWIGGLAYLTLTIWTLVRSTDGNEAARVIAHLVPRFSTMAAVCVGIVLFSGIYATWLNVGSTSALLATPYGRALLAKLACVAPLLGIAAINRLVLSPRLRWASERDPLRHDLARRLRQSVAGEVVFALGALVAVAVMTNLQPARQALAAQGATLEKDAEDLRVTLRVQPGLATLNRFDVFLADRTGRPVEDVQRVELRFDMQTMDMGESELVAIPHGDGHYVTQGGALAMAGPWDITVLVRRAGRDDVRATMRTDVGPAPAPNSAPAAPKPGEANVVLGAQLLATGLIALAAGVLARRRRSLRWAAPLAAFGLVTGAVLALQGASTLSVSAVRNPIPPTQQSIARGEEIYRADCAMCHGISGRGDGPAGLALVPRPADFRVHLAAGHTDGQLFDWISNGFPGSAMPAWKDRLNEEDRWNVLNYLQQTFGPNVTSGR